MARGRAFAALAVVVAVFVMHGLSCMQGNAHGSGVAVAAMAPATGHASSGHSTACPDCHGNGPGPAAADHGIATSLSMPALLGAGTGTGTGHDAHSGAECVAILVGIALLALLAAGVSTTKRAADIDPGLWVRMPPRAPTALHRPSLASLCVLRT